MVVFPSGDLKMVQLLVEGGANVFGNTKQGLPYYLTGTSQVGRFLLIEMPATVLLDSVQIQVSGSRITSFLGIRKISLIQKQLRFFVLYVAGVRLLTTSLGTSAVDFYVFLNAFSYFVVLLLPFSLQVNDYV